MKKLILSALLLFSAANGFCANIGSPQAVRIKFYEFWVSQNANCSDMTRLYNDSSASYQDVTNNISFGDITVPNGTYPCVAVKFSDIVELVPNFTSDGGNCVQGTTYSRDLFRGGDTSTSPDGSVINGSGNASPPGQVENTMYAYFSTSGNNTTNSGMAPSEPALISTPFIVNGDNTATFVWDFTNGIEDTGGSCSPESVTFGFR
ncbi:MAG: hypothetical protein KCHDKBKB_02564 [Elusimicrobia bacterium]|nr:hypothetical protein [Elusimicrobiota bacterium]